MKATARTRPCSTRVQHREAGLTPLPQRARHVLHADADGDGEEHARGHGGADRAPALEQPGDDARARPPKLSERKKIQAKVTKANTPMRGSQTPCHGLPVVLERRRGGGRAGAPAAAGAASARPSKAAASSRRWRCTSSALSLRRSTRDVLDDQGDAVQEAPEDERPAGAVPEPAEHHGEHQVHVGARAALAVAAERDVQVVAQPARQRHVPAAPELLHRARRVRRVEVVRQLEPQQQRDADGDVGVGAEVAVDLHRVADDAEQHLERRVLARRREHAVDDVGREVVGDQHLLDQAAEDEEEGPRGVHVAWIARAVQLRQELGRAGDRAGGQVREEGDVHREVEQRRRPQACRGTRR